MLPPSEHCRITGLRTSEGDQITGSIVDAILTAKTLETLGSKRSLPYARAQAIRAAQFAKDKLGVQIVGLGETLAANTHHGKVVDDEVVHTTTGHGYTTYLIKATAEQAATLAHLDLSRSTISIIGAAGSIGRSS